MPKRTRPQRCRYTVEPGRQIHMNGKPFISIGREGDPRDMSPHATDRLTHQIAAWLNRKGCFVVRAYPEVEKWSR